MPWKETDPVRERDSFVRLAESGRYSFSDLCDLFGISRKTGYKRLRLYRKFGVDGLTNQSRAAHTHPNATPAEICDRILRVKRMHPSWGPQTILEYLRSLAATISWPATSTAAQILDRAGLVKKRIKRHPCSAPPRPEVGPIEEPNEVWNIDFMGQFRTGDGSLCYALTTTDTYTRALLLCRAFHHPTYQNTQRELEACFRQYGLPLAIRSDNGEPFVSYRSPAGLSRLGVWLTKLGIRRIRTRPGCPQDNGLHERMHRTLRGATARPAAGSLAAQQRRFNAFVVEYNQTRPHRALDGRTPQSLYTRSPRPFPKALSPIEYPGHYEPRIVRANGQLLWKSKLIFLSEVFASERVGLEEIADGTWRIYFGPILLGLLDERRRKIIPAQA